MALERYNAERLSAYLDELKKQYDSVRLVNPSECRIFSVRSDGAVNYGPYCYGVWNISNRCTNCISLQALETEAELDKDETRDGSIYHIHSRPIEIELGDGSFHPCVVEMITVEPAETKNDDSRSYGKVSRERFADTLTYVIQNIHSGIACFNLSGQCIYANAEVFRMFDCRDDLDTLQNVIERWLRPADPNASLWTQSFHNGKYRRTFEVQRFPLKDHLNKTIGSYCFFFDRSDDANKFKTEHYRATHDELTQVLNRYGFYSEARSTLEDNPENSYLLLVSVIKDFHMYNELFGEKKGNELLVKTAGMLKDYISTADSPLLGRLQDDRFALLIKEEDFDEDQMTEGFNAVTERFSGESFPVLCHTGIYRIDERTVPVAVMCERAAAALDAIADTGRNAFSRYSRDMMEHALHELSVFSEFHEALKNGQFQIFLQPQISCDEVLLGAEALCRWIHPLHGIITPKEFIPVLEDSGEIHHLDKYIWEEAVKLLKRWENTTFEHLFLSVNISAKDFYCLDLYKTFTSLVEQYGIPPKKLKLEITEAVFLSDSRRTSDLIRRLQDYGFEVEIDNFGSGCSSLNLLKDLNADVLKIDMSLLHETENRDRSKTILSSVIAMSKDLGMPVVLEGVETSQQIDFLKKIGCDIFQGYYFSRPIPVSEFEEKYMPAVSSSASAQ